MNTERLYLYATQAKNLGDNYAALEDSIRTRPLYELAQQLYRTYLATADENTEEITRLIEDLENKKLKHIAQVPAEIDPAELHDMFDFHYEEGDRELTAGLLREAAESFMGAARIGQALLEREDTLDNIHHTCMACKNAGEILLKLRRFGEAVEHFDRMENLANRAMAMEQNMQDLYLANLAQAGAGAAYSAWGRREDARKRYQMALHSATVLASIGPAAFQGWPEHYQGILDAL